MLGISGKIFIKNWSIIMFHLAFSAKKVIPTEQSGMLFFLENPKKFREIHPIRTFLHLWVSNFCCENFSASKNSPILTIFLDFPLHQRSTTEAMNKWSSPKSLESFADKTKQNFAKNYWKATKLCGTHEQNLLSVKWTRVEVSEIFSADFRWNNADSELIFVAFRMTVFG